MFVDHWTSSQLRHWFMQLLQLGICFYTKESHSQVTVKLQTVLNPAACLITGAQKYHCGLSRVMHDKLH